MPGWSALNRSVRPYLRCLRGIDGICRSAIRHSDRLPEPIRFPRKCVPCIMITIRNVGCWLVDRFAIVPIFSKLFWTLALFGRFTIVARNLGRAIFWSKKCLCKNIWTFFLKKKLAFPPVIKHLLKNDFSTNFQGTGPWEGRVHFSRFVFRVHNCSKLFQSWSWSQEKKGRPLPQAIAKFKVQTFPKIIRQLMKLNPY